MKPLKQRNLHRPSEGIWGDCHRAAIASILELPLEDVPNFGEGGPDGDEFHARVREWLRPRGLMEIQVAYSADDLGQLLRCVASHNPGVYYLLGGFSKTGVGHTVVCLNDEIVHDPSLVESGITGPMDDGFYWVTYFGSCVALSEAKHAAMA